MAAAVVVAGLCVPAGAGAALGITVSGVPERLIAGDEAVLTARVTNLGAADVTDMRVIFNPQWDPFESDPPKLAGLGCDDSLTPPTLNCSRSGIWPLNAFSDVTATATLPGTGTIEIQVGANAEETSSGLPVYSPTVVFKRTYEPKADTKLELSATPTQPRPNDPVTVRAVATNTRAEGIAYGTSVKFSIPAGVEILDKPADCTGTALNISCPVGDLAPQTSREKLITVRSATEGSFAILSSVTWARPDPTPIDTQAQINVTVVTPPPDPEPVPKTTTPPKPVTAKPGTIAQGLPLSGRCVRSRRISFVLRSIRAFDPVRAVIRITGRKRALIVKGGRALEPISITLPKRRGRVLLRLEVTYDSGRTYKASRAFRRC